MNKKYIIFVVMLCVLVVPFTVFTGFAPQTVQDDDIMPLDSDKYIVVTGVANVSSFELLFSDAYDYSIAIVGSSDATKLGSNIYRFTIPDNLRSDELFITLLASDSDRLFYINRVLYSYGGGTIHPFLTGVELYQSTVYFRDQDLPRWDTLYFDFSVTWNADIYNSLQRELDNVSNQLSIANDTIDTLQDTVDSLKSGSSALDFVGTAFEKVGNILQIEIFPNITIGTIVSVPLILGVVFLILRLVRGE